MTDMKRVLITGATGFIGSVLAVHLRAMNYYVLGMTRCVARLPEHKMHLVDQWINCARYDDELMNNVDYVVHLAGNAHLTKAAPYSEYHRHNTVSTEKLAAAAARCSVEKFIFVSTIAVNGPNFESESSAVFTEESAVHPAGGYGLSKYQAEQVLKDICRHHNMHFVILRPPLVYGPGVKANFLTLMRAASRGMPLPLASVKNARSFIYVENLADIIAKCLINDHVNDSLYLVQDLSISVPAMIRQLSGAMGSRTTLFPFPLSLLFCFFTLMGRRTHFSKLTSSLVVDDKKIRHDLKWKPKISFERSIAETVRWFKQGRG